MTKLGEYLAQKYINKAELARNTGITQNRLSYLSNNEKSEIKAKELLLIAKALNIPATELIEVLFDDLKIPQRKA